jgi:hypothetical protein
MMKHKYSLLIFTLTVIITSIFLSEVKINTDIQIDSFHSSVLLTTDLNTASDPVTT